MRLWQKKKLVNQITSNPYYRFQSATEIAIASELGIKIDVNQATVDDWLRLPGLSINQARNLVEIVNSGLHFLCLEDLAGALGVSLMSIKIWEPILYFAYYASDSFIAPAKVNVNQASIEQLMTVPNLEESLAKKIINEKKNHGNYQHIADLKMRVNLTHEMSYHLMAYLQF